MGFGVVVGVLSVVFESGKMPGTFRGCVGLDFFNNDKSSIELKSTIKICWPQGGHESGVLHCTGTLRVLK